MIEVEKESRFACRSCDSKLNVHAVRVGDERHLQTFHLCKNCIGELIARLKKKIKPID